MDLRGMIFFVQVKLNNYKQIYVRRENADYGKVKKLKSIALTRSLGSIII